MMKHSDVWRAIDRLARENSLSVSGLAKAAGLNPSSFAKGKRISRSGTPRWPGMESLAKILETTSTSFGVT